MFSNTACPRRRGDALIYMMRGYTLIELMLVVCLIGILGSMVVLQIGASRPGMIGDGGMRLMMAQLNFARDSAIAQRRRIEVTFVGNNTIQLTRHNVPNGTTVLQAVTFESGLQFGLVPGKPDTPDGFGNGSATDFQGAASVLFSTDGSLIDATGAPLNGTIFLMLPGSEQSWRAVTVLGATGRVRAYRWAGIKWTRV
jgi:prepilin-type N-terminal cleavage/methylation domain-containing protein